MNILLPAVELIGGWSLYNGIALLGQPRNALPGSKTEWQAQQLLQFILGAATGCFSAGVAL